MSDQATLFDQETEADKKFAEFHGKNPQVYTTLVKLAREWKARRHNKLSIELLVNVFRWNMYMQTNDPNSDFKINNNYKSRYARKIMLENADLEGIFNIRELKS